MTTTKKTPHEKRMKDYSDGLRSDLSPDAKHAMVQCAFVWSVMTSLFRYFTKDPWHRTTLRCVRNAVAPTNPKLKRFFKETK